MPNTYQAQVTTPEQDKILDELRKGLSWWLVGAGEKNIDYSLALTALMLFTASGAAGAATPREAFLDLMGRYYDMYVTAMKKQS